MYFNDQLFLDGNKGKAFLLIHGLSSGCAQMVPMAKMINDYGYAVHTVNVAGHGTYPKELLHVTMEDMIEKAMYDVDMLKRHYDEVYVTGLSLGGGLTLAVGSLRDDLAGIAPISAPYLQLPNLFTSQDRGDKLGFDRSLAGKVGIAQQYHIHYEWVAFNVVDQAGRLSDYIRNTDMLSKITCPCFVGQAKNDDTVDPISGPKIFENISSSKKVLYNPDEGGHNLTFTEGRFELMKHMAEFFEMTK